MALRIEYITVGIDGLSAYSERKQQEGWRFVQVLAATSDTGVDLVYAFMKDDVLENCTVPNVQPDDTVPSITDRFLAAFVFENEVHDLFGVRIQGIAIDFEGKFYDVTESEPMRLISPEFKAVREKAAKVAAAKAAKAAKAAQEAKAAAAATEVNR